MPNNDNNKSNESKKNPDKGKQQGTSKNSDTANRDSAAEIIRQKIEYIYSDEPAATEEIKEVEKEVPSGKTFTSAHQEFMYNLANSGKSLAETQAEWHNYYLSLPDDEKLKVWQEFYEANGHTPKDFSRAAEQIHEAQEKVEKERSETTSRRKKKENTKPDQSNSS